MHIINGLKFEESQFDHQYLLQILAKYKNPRQKINALLKQKNIIRVKKGIYVIPNTQYSINSLANIIYGPSYVSFESALAYYGLIPERVVHSLNATSGRNKEFSTPLCVFQYRHIPLKLYAQGISRLKDNSGRAFLIASPEKAIIDMLYTVKKIRFSKKTMYMYLFEDMRIDEVEFKRLDRKVLQQIITAYPLQKFKFLFEVFQEVSS